MSGKVSRKSKMAAWVLIIVNLLCMVCCTVLFSTALWMIGSPSSLSSLIQTSGNRTLKALFPPSVVSVQLGVGIAVVTIFVFIICLMGFYGAVTRSPFLLFMYATLVLLMLLLECALIFYFASNFIEKGLQEQDGQWTHALRIAFKCCDYNITLQSQDSPKVTKLPWSCCGAPGYEDNCTSTQIFAKDCRTTISSWLDRYQVAIYVTLIVLHVILSSCSLLRRSSSASRSHS